MKWKHFPYYWPVVRGIDRSQVIFPHKATDTELWCFFYLHLNKRLTQNTTKQNKHEPYTHFMGRNHNKTQPTWTIRTFSRTKTQPTWTICTFYGTKPQQYTTNMDHMHILWDQTTTIHNKHGPYAHFMGPNHNNTQQTWTICTFYGTKPQQYTTNMDHMHILWYIP